MRVLDTALESKWRSSSAIRSVLVSLLLWEPAVSWVALSLHTTKCNSHHTTSWRELAARMDWVVIETAPFSRRRGVNCYKQDTVPTAQEDVATAAASLQLLGKKFCSQLMTSVAIRRLIDW